MDTLTPLGVVDDQGIIAAKQAIELPLPKISTSRNVFTVSHASAHPDAASATAFLDKHAPQLRDDMDCQRIAIQNHNLAKLREFVEKSEMKSTVGEKERVVALKCLVRRAAENDIQYAHKCNYPLVVVQFMRRTWQVLLRQVQEHLSEAHSEDSQDAVPLLEQRHREAIENISALGLWFVGDMSIPFRRYSLQMTAADGTLQNVIAVGLVSFSYSSYVMDSRRRAQEATLAELERLSKRLGVKLHFLPSLVLPEEAKAVPL
ncbi:hypothetical protein DQ04_12321000 [Trypanosoma grayi]|uniref:hypothetical protein n=1 Tax=Trypanosoma grayi TaxID=71804 RepID=UPI0004F4511A|nr:hypothetical protein DQ04_12321000 [Trypanosoma grayi]KEG06770.1 hypothetical protein DQ04_12321000 [Trypanosoma grayi]